MKWLAVIAFFGGLLLGVRVMFFGVQRRLGEEHIAHRIWPLALATFLVVGGAMLYAWSSSGGRVTFAGLLVVLVAATGAALAGWWVVKRSASAPSTDPEDDPRYRFQGHVARVIKTVPRPAPGDSPASREAEALDGRIAFVVDGKQYELSARWVMPSSWNDGMAGHVGSEVVIERVESDVAYVEPWTAVEQRL